MNDAQKKRGRPARGLPPRSWVSTKLDESDHDRLIRLAAMRRASVAAVMRALLRAALSHHMV